MKQARYLLLKALLTFLMIVLGFVIQTAVFRGLKLAGVVPNIMIMITATMGFMRGCKTGACTGFVCGMFIDLYMCSLFGTYTFIYMLLGFINGGFNRLFYGEGIRLPIFMVAGTDILYGFTVYFALFFFRHRTDTMYYFMNVIMPEMVYTVVVYIFVYFLLYRFNLLMESIDKRSTRRVA